LAATLLLAAAGCGGDGTTSPASDVAPTDAVLQGDATGQDAAADAAPPLDSVDAGSDLGADGDAAGGDTGGPPDPLEPLSLAWNGTIHAVWGPSADEAWLVGEAGVLLHWNGQTLAPRASGTMATLRAVHGRSKDDVYFAGDNVVLRWDGASVTNITPVEIKGDWHGVVAPPDSVQVLVAGAGGLVARRLDKGTWKAEATSTTVDLFAITATSAGSVWAAGAFGTVVRLSGGNWLSDQAAVATITLYAVTTLGDGGIAVAGTGGFLAQWDGKGWASAISNDPVDPPRDLYALWSPGKGEAWAIGKDGVLLKFAGGKWGVVDITGPYLKSKTFRGLWGWKKGDVTVALAVGEEGAGLHNDGKGAWKDFPAKVARDLRDITVLPDGRIVVPGEAGLLLVAPAAGEAFEDLAVDVTGTTMEGACDDGAGGFWAVGDKGTVVHAGKGGTPAVEVVGAAHLRGCARVGTTTVAVGEGGLVFARADGGAWKAEASGAKDSLTSIAAMAEGGVAVGKSGIALLRTASGTWKPESTGTTTHLNRVTAWGASEAAAAGDNGLVLHRKGGSWKKLHEEAGTFVYGIARLDDGRIVAAGWAGLVLAGQPDAIGHVVTSAKTVLLGAASVGKKALLVGKGGAVYTFGGTP